MAELQQKLAANTAGMYGDLSGIIGKSLPAIDQLELSNLPERNDEPLLAAVSN